MKEERSSSIAPQNSAQYPGVWGESVLTDTVLDELKKQSINGCLLCFFDAWDEEEWD